MSADLSPKKAFDRLSESDGQFQSHPRLSLQEQFLSERLPAYRKKVVAERANLGKNSEFQEKVEGTRAQALRTYAQVKAYLDRSRISIIGVIQMHDYMIGQLKPETLKSINALSRQGLELLRKAGRSAAGSGLFDSALEPKMISRALRDLRKDIGDRALTFVYRPVAEYVFFEEDMGKQLSQLSKFIQRQSKVSGLSSAEGVLLGMVKRIETVQSVTAEWTFPGENRPHTFKGSTGNHLRQLHSFCDKVDFLGILLPQAVGEAGELVASIGVEASLRAMFCAQMVAAVLESPQSLEKKWRSFLEVQELKFSREADYHLHQAARNRIGMLEQECCSGEKLQSDIYKIAARSLEARMLRYLQFASQAAEDAADDVSSQEAGAIMRQIGREVEPTEIRETLDRLRILLDDSQYSFLCEEFSRLIGNSSEAKGVDSEEDKEFVAELLAETYGYGSADCQQIIETLGIRNIELRERALAAIFDTLQRPDSLQSLLERYPRLFLLEQDQFDRYVGEFGEIAERLAGRQVLFREPFSSLLRVVDNMLPERISDLKRDVSRGLRNIRHENVGH